VARGRLGGAVSCCGAALAGLCDVEVGFEEVDEGESALVNGGDFRLGYAGAPSGAGGVRAEVEFGRYLAAAAASGLTYETAQ
jgi:hypothetical protein